MNKLATIDIYRPRYTVVRHYLHQENRETWVVFDTTVPDGVTEVPYLYGLTAKVFRPAAVQSAHWTMDRASAAAEAANAAEWGVTVEELDAERQRRMIADIAEISGRAVEEVAARAEALRK